MDTSVSDGGTIVCAGDGRVSFFTPPSEGGPWEVTGVPDGAVSAGVVSAGAVSAGVAGATPVVLGGSLGSSPLVDLTVSPSDFFSSSVFTFVFVVPVVESDDVVASGDVVVAVEEPVDEDEVVDEDDEVVEEGEVVVEVVSAKAGNARARINPDNVLNVRTYARKNVFIFMSE
ncbi:MAG: hypothetical protein HYU99_10400 [Deltaproteobacteria bacterium]|nr:hypothetical protein [Deltaproteobacteria bacterium]